MEKPECPFVYGKFDNPPIGEDSIKNQKKEIEMEEFEIRSTKVASFLITRGHRVIKTSRGDAAVFFHFIKTPKLEADVEALRFGDDSASVRALYSARDYLMTLIHESGDFQR